MSYGLVGKLIGHLTDLGTGLKTFVDVWDQFVVGSDSIVFDTIESDVFDYFSEVKLDEISEQFGRVASETYDGTEISLIGDSVTAPSAPPSDDFNNSISTFVELGSGVLTATSAASGRIGTPGDADWFKVELMPGYHCVFGATADVDTNSMVDPILYLRDASGNYVVHNDDYASDKGTAIVTYTVPNGAGGTYYLEVWGYGNTTGRDDLAGGGSPSTPVGTTVNLIDPTVNPVSDANWTWQSDNEDNRFLGTSGTDRIRGHDGDDNLRGSSSSDTIWGDADDNHL